MAPSTASVGAMNLEACSLSLLVGRGRAMAGGAPSDRIACVDCGGTAYPPDRVMPRSCNEAIANIRPQEEHQRSSWCRIPGVQYSQRLTRFSSPTGVDKGGVVLKLALHTSRFLFGRCGDRAGEADSRKAFTDVGRYLRFEQFSAQQVQYLGRQARRSKQHHGCVRLDRIRDDVGQQWQVGK